MFVFLQIIPICIKCIFPIGIYDEISNVSFHANSIYTVSTPAAVGYVQKESVELFVYLTIGIWRSLQTNKQYPTPNSIYQMIYAYTR